MTALSPTHSPTHSSAPVLRRLAVLLGWLSLFATLALLSPGVVATANAEELAEQAAGPSCPAADAADEGTAVHLSQMIDRLESQVAEGKGEADGVVPLNTRGYNYPRGNPREAERGDR